MQHVKMCRKKVTSSVLYKVNFVPVTRYANMAFGSEKASKPYIAYAAHNVPGPQLHVPLTLSCHN
jgi:hypothetical protein